VVVGFQELDDRVLVHVAAICLESAVLERVAIEELCPLLLEPNQYQNVEVRLTDCLLKIGSALHPNEPGGWWVDLGVIYFAGLGGKRLQFPPCRPVSEL
jgi:hypothetical protein